MIKILKQTLLTQFVDEETGEIFEDKREFNDDSVKSSGAKKATTKKSSKKNPYDENPEPVLVREENKLILNTAALEALGAEEGDRINIKEQAINRRKRLVIGLSDTFGTKEGNLLTKSHTIRWSGKNAEMVARYGDEFNFLPYEKKEGLFILVNVNEDTETTNPDEADEEEVIDVAQEIAELNADLEDETEVLSDDLNFNFD